MAKILVTGGLGTLGRPLVEELRSRGNDVWVADIPRSDKDKYFRCNVSEYRQLARIFDAHDFDLVYHLAAEFGRKNGERFYENLWKTNAIGTKNVLHLQREHDFRLVFFSSSEVYGDHQGVMSEDVPVSEGMRQLNDYAISKWVNELQVLHESERYGTETVRVRPFNLYGPGEEFSEYRSVVVKFCYWALHDEPYTVYENHHRPFTYVDDAIRTMANISENFVPGEVYNIANDEVYSVRELSDTVLEQVERDDDIVTYEEVEEHNTLDKEPTIDRAIRDLNHDPQVSLDEGVRRTLAWMRDHYDVE